MDSGVLIQIAITGGTIAVALIGTYTIVVRNKAKIEIDDATFLRSQILTKDDWQKQSEKKDKEHEDEITRINAAHELRINSMLTLHQIEKQALIDKVKDQGKRIDEQDVIIKDLQMQITHNKV